MRRGVIFGVLVMVAGIVLGVALVISAFLTVTQTVNDFARIGFDEPTDLVFDEGGEYTVYFEALDLDPGTEAPISLSVTRVSTDEAVEIERYDGDATYTKDGREGQAAFTIDIPAAGAYRVEAGLALDDAGSALAVGRDIGGDLVRRVLWGVVLAVIVIALGLAIVVVSIARGSFEPGRSGAAARARSTAPLRERSAGARAVAAEAPPPPAPPRSWAQVGEVVRDDPRRALRAARAVRADPRAAAEALLGDDPDAVFEEFQADPQGVLAGALDRLAEPATPSGPLTPDQLAELPDPPPGPAAAAPPSPPAAAPPPAPASPPEWQLGYRRSPETAHSPEPAHSPETARSPDTARSPEVARSPDPPRPSTPPETAPAREVPAPEPTVAPAPGPGEPAPPPTGYVPLAAAPLPRADQEFPIDADGSDADRTDAGDAGDDESAADWEPEDLTPPPRFATHDLTPPPSYGPG